MTLQEQKAYRFLLSEYIKSNKIESLDELFESEYELELDRIHTDEAPSNDIRDAALFVFQEA